MEVYGWSTQALRPSFELFAHINVQRVPPVCTKSMVKVAEFCHHSHVHCKVMKIPERTERTGRQARQFQRVGTTVPRKSHVETVEVPQ